MAVRRAVGGGAAKDAPAARSEQLQQAPVVECNQGAFDEVGFGMLDPSNDRPLLTACCRTEIFLAGTLADLGRRGGCYALER